LAQNRRLAAIMFTDIVGFSRLTNLNPLLARELNEEHQKIVRQCLAKCEGFERQTTGDGFFLEFKSAIQAMNCAIEIQQTLHDRNLVRSAENQIQIRIGLHLGDIFEKNDEIFGDGVNIAARLEALAEPGGVCLSRTFYDLVKSNWSESKFSLAGKVQLKNIQGEQELFKFNFPWNSQKKNRFKSFFKLTRTIFNQEQWSLISLFFAGFAVLLFVFAKGFLPQFQSLSNLRSPSAAYSEVKLDEGWTYSVDRSQWHDFNPKQSWRYADILRGTYELKKEFSLNNKPLEPTMILGLVSDSHRVYLNGHYIGGSEHLSDLALYNIEPSFINLAPEKNVILIRGNTRPSLNPGLMILEDAKPQLGEFSQISDLHSKYYFKFYILKNIFFVFSFIIFLLSLTYALYLKNKNEIFYSALFLLLGCLGYAYYNPWVTSTFDFEFLRFLRLSCILMSSIVLFSGYLTARGQSRFCSWNNLLGLVVGASIFLFFQFYSFQSSKEFVAVYNAYLLVGLVYIAFVGTTALVQEIANRKELVKMHSSLEAYFFLGFTFFNQLNILGSFKNSQTDIFFSANLRSWFNDAGISVTFLFALARVTIAVFEFTQQKRLNLLNKRKDDFFIELTRVVAEAKSIHEKVEQIQKLAHQFLKSEKSSLYLICPENRELLQLHSARGYTKQIEPVRSASAGAFGYILQNRRPLLIEDIQQDYRFESSHLQDFQEMKSGTCMVFPLIVEQEVLGIMTFLDKENHQKFTMSDLEVGLKMSIFVSLLISHLQENQKVS
jgi:class 3 adenylate cyclase